MIDDTSIENVMLAAKRMMQFESRHNFGVYAIDDREHIPRMERMADAVWDALSERGLAPALCDACRDDLIEYARQLYVTEWMRPLPGDDTPPVEEDAIMEFNKHLERNKKRAPR